MGATHLSGLSIGMTVLADSTLTVNEWDHAGRTIYLSIAGAQTITLPAATGSGNMYRFVVGVTATGNKIVKVASATDYMNGVAIVANDTDASASLFETANSGSVATESDTITMNGTTTGGYVGAIIEVQDVASAKWWVRTTSAASGAEATPFSAAV